LDGKVAVVTGGASGIGRAIVQSLRGAGLRSNTGHDLKQAEAVALEVIRGEGNASAFSAM